MGLFSKKKEKVAQAIAPEPSNTKATAVTAVAPAVTDAKVDLTTGGKLVVRIIESRNITTKPGARPLCVISYGHNQILTPPTAKVNGAWNFTLQYDITNLDDLTITVQDSTAPSGQDFIGQVQIQPNLSQPGFNHEHWYSLTSLNGKQKVSGEIKVATIFKMGSKKLTIDDFELLKVIGKGSFGKVMQVRKKDTGRIYAMKILKKSQLAAREEIEHTKAERKILAKNTNPFLVGLKFSFQTADKVYLVLDYVNGGELFFHLQNEGTFAEERARFYAAQLLLALEHLHKQDVIYRDLKPENILIDYDGYIALTDFGLCKENVRHNDTTNTFCGTPEYMAPEVLQQKGYGPSVDWWTLGILLYEMLTGLPPFYDENTNAMYQKILYGELTFPNDVSPAAKQVITNLLQRDPTKRLGSGKDGALTIKRSDFFKAVDWDSLLAKSLQPAWKPPLADKLDTSNFDEEFTAMPALDSVVEDSALSKTLQAQFKGFTFVEEEGFGV
eukprot:Clim_evm29s6 gene=Clim_evmTU29s6